VVSAEASARAGDGAKRESARIMPAQNAVILALGNRNTELDRIAKPPCRKILPGANDRQGS
jgi:hypothetical protein